MNNSGPRYKRSKVERDLNVDVIACVIILFILCIVGGVGELILTVHSPELLLNYDDLLLRKTAHFHSLILVL